jgi:hypothetical protein
MNRHLHWAFVALTGCSSDSALSCPEPAILAPQARTNSRADVEAILGRSCALGGCHSGAEGASGLTLPLGGAWRNLVVGRRSLQNPSMDLVKAGDPTKSWLFLKIAGTPCGTCAPELGCGGRMPFNRPLPEGEIATVAAWVRNGALP